MFNTEIVRVYDTQKESMGYREEALTLFETFPRRDYLPTIEKVGTVGSPRFRLVGVTKEEIHAFVKLGFEVRYTVPLELTENSGLIPLSPELSIEFYVVRRKDSKGKVSPRVYRNGVRLAGAKLKEAVQELRHLKGNLELRREEIFARSNYHGTFKDFFQSVLKR